MENTRPDSDGRINKEQETHELVGRLLRLYTHFPELNESYLADYDIDMLEELATELDKVLRSYARLLMAGENT